MNLLLRTRATAAPLPATPAGGVPDTLLSDLRAHSVSCPVKGLNDPRLQYPELLLIDGSEREHAPAGCTFAYVYSGDTAADGSQRWEQSYQVGDDGSALLVSRCGHTESTIRRDPQGRINTSYRMV